MGIVHAEIELLRGGDLNANREGKLPFNRVRRMKVKALVDSGAYMMVINEPVRKKLKLLTVNREWAELADGSRVELDVVGPLEVRFENRRANVDALVLPGNSEVLLGAIPMEYMDVLIDPKNHRLIVNPKNPEFPVTILK